MPYEFILNAFLGDAPATISEGASGYNNTTRYVQSQGARYVLRIYETHQDSSKIRFEHDVLLKLGELRLPFRVPQPVRLPDGRSYVQLEDGTGRFACLFLYIEGTRPDSRDPLTAGSVGETVGRLSRALATIAPNQAPEYPPYYEMDLAHPSCDSETIRRFCCNPPAEFEELAEELASIRSELEDFRSVIPALRGLPHQLVHGDINDSNLLASPEYGNPIEAVLDFEFATRDLRAMEPAVVLSGMLESEGLEETIPAFLAGFSGVVRLTEPEALAIPQLIRLRKLDVFVHFLGRYRDGVDRAEVLQEQVADAASGLAALRKQEPRLLEWCRAGME
ncbi:phosphotransferase [Cohnella sp. AR92]|uniref:phosphotransferase n=1 Tax=Cohnella sp. AR92 TaxID=648716 RepID=UPI00131522DA|nr:phosphotransferase [Cohnella sp. AR92]